MLRACLAAGLLSVALAVPVGAQDAQALRARHADLGEQLAASPFGRPLQVMSHERSSEQRGEVYATVAQAFGTVAAALLPLRNWCDILILPVNVKHCEASGPGAAETLRIHLARNPHDALEETFRLELAYEVLAATDDYLQVALSAPDGPFGTRNYRMGLEAAPLDSQHTILYLSYAFRPGLAARLAMQLYLATSGRDKVGFTLVERLPDGEPVYIDGVRGAIERNTMRYFLAIEAYLGALDAPPPERLERRLRAWHAASERHRPQLYEIGRDEYLRMKRQEAGAVMAAARSANQAPR